MKWKPGKKQLSIMLSVIIIGVVLMLFYYVLFNWKAVNRGVGNIFSILTPIIIGCVIAYILIPVLNFIESRWIYPIYRFNGIDLKNPQNRKRRKKVRSVSVLLTIAFLFLIVYAMMAVLVPQIIKSINEIITNFPIYVSNTQRFIDKYLTDNPQIRSMVDSLFQQYSSTITDMLKTKLLPNVTTVLQRVSKSMITAIQVFFYLVVGIIVAIYVLNSKEHFAGQAKKLCYAFMKKETANEVISAFRYANFTFTGFVIGKLVDSLIIGLVAFIFCEILKIPYPVLLGFIVGITNIIPFFGPYIGGFVGGILLVMINPIKALVFLIMLMILQQIDGNILGPIILGNSTGLSSFWVIFSIMLFGGIMGPIGWLIGVPTFACLYTFIGYVTKKKLRERMLPRDTSTYINAAYIDENGVTTIDEADNSKYYVHNEASSLRRVFKIYKKSKKLINNVVPNIAPELTENNQDENDDVKKDQVEDNSNDDKFES